MNLYVSTTPQSAIKQSNEDTTPISFVLQSSDEKVSTDDLNRLEPSFMDTHIFKRILLDMKHEDGERQAIVKICLKNNTGNSIELSVVEEFSKGYCPNKAIWWYTRECFTYKMLNQALRCLECDIVIDMGPLFMISTQVEQNGSVNGP